MRTSFSFLFIFLSAVVVGQDFNIDGRWENMGPVDLPIYKHISTTGTGPVEFVQISSKKTDYMLAGSLYGGLFFSNNGGELWINAGSDNWDYSSCGWAGFHPGDENMWFATSMQRTKKGKPGKLGKLGGVFRTVDQGANWESIADYSDFDRNSYVVIYGIRFHPKQVNKMYILTSIGMYFTEDCTAKNVKWNKVSYLDGMVYDLEVGENQLCASFKSKGKWNVVYSEDQQLLPIKKVKEESREINQITIENLGADFYLLVDFTKDRDEVWHFNGKTKETKVVCNRGRLIFGAGYAFALNPFNRDEFMIGNGLRIRKWNIPESKFYSLDNSYHVDVEHIIYHPTVENKLYISTHGGIFMSADNGGSWEFKSKGIGNAEVHGMAVSESDPEQIAIGLNHDGSLVRADWSKDGNYNWRFVNGGDALLPLINKNNPAVVYTSNQYTGGGIYYSDDTSKTVSNIHSKNGMRTSGWVMSAVLHPVEDSILFFNYMRSKKEGGERVDIARTFGNCEKEKTEVISNFYESHGLEKYQVYGIFNSKFHPDVLLAYVLHSTKNSKGKAITSHKLFILNNALDSSASVINNWRELELPRNGWIGDIEMDPKKWFKLYISYTIGTKANASKPDDKGMIFYTKYKKKSLAQTRSWDISANIPSGACGRYNLVYTTEDGKAVFFATRSGVYMGTKSTLRGGKSWQKVGTGLPHCKVNGLHYHEEKKLLTVGLEGRGVWRIDLSKN